MGHAHGRSHDGDKEFDVAETMAGRLHLNSHASQPRMSDSVRPSSSLSSAYRQTLPPNGILVRSTSAADNAVGSYPRSDLGRTIHEARPPPHPQPAVSEALPVKPIIIPPAMPAASPSDDSDESPPADKPSSPDPAKVPTPERQLPRVHPPKERKTAKDIFRSNSTSTMYVDNTIDHPNNALTTLCVAKAVLRIMQNDSTKRPVVHPSFEMTQSQRARLGLNHIGFPSLSIIHTFLANFYRDAQLAPECNVVGFCYLIRFLRATGVTLSPSNWRQLLYACFCLSSKMYDDLSMINRDFAIVCPMFTLQETNEMELALLDVFRFDLAVSGAEYAAFYFRLMQEKQQQPPSAPLRKLTAQQLEVALPSTSLAAPKTMPRNTSFDGLKSPPPQPLALLS